MNSLDNLNVRIYSTSCCPVGWGRRIQLLLCREVRPHLNECSGYDTKQSDDQAPALYLWGMWSTLSLALLPEPLWPEEVAPDRVLSLCQIEQTMWAKRWLKLNCESSIAIRKTI